MCFEFRKREKISTENAGLIWICFIKTIAAMWYYQSISFLFFLRIKRYLGLTLEIVWTRNKQTCSSKIKRKCLRSKAALIFHHGLKRRKVKRKYFTAIICNSARKKIHDFHFVEWNIQTGADFGYGRESIMWKVREHEKEPWIFN